MTRPDSLHVLFVTPSFVPFIGGAQAFQLAMAQRLLADGHQVTVLTSTARSAPDFWQPPPADSPPPPLRETRQGVQIQRLAIAYPRPAPLLFGLARRVSHRLAGLPLPAAIQLPLLTGLARLMPPLPGLKQALDALLPQVDLVQITDASWDGLFTVTARMARDRGKPVVAVPLMHLGDPAVTAHFTMPHQRQAYWQAQALVALSRQEARAFIQLGAEQGRIHVLAMGVEPRPAFQPRPQDVASFRREHGLTGPVVAFLGANTYDKGAFTLVQAVARLNIGGENVHLVMAGPQADGLRRFVAGLPAESQAVLADRLHILGPVDERTKQLLLASCQVFALPSQVDTFGIVLLEAWLHGKPVVAAAAGGLPELVQPGETGLLVPFGQEEALAAALGTLLRDQEQAQRLGGAGRQQVLARFTWDRTYAQLRAIYDPLLAGTPRS